VIDHWISRPEREHHSGPGQHHRQRRAVFAIAQTAYRLWFAATPLNASLEAIVFGSPATGPSLAVVLAGAAMVLALGP
jgi:hypothetical protein